MSTGEMKENHIQKESIRSQHTKLGKKDFRFVNDPKTDEPSGRSKVACAPESIDL